MYDILPNFGFDALRISLTVCKNPPKCIMITSLPLIQFEYSTFFDNDITLTTPNRPILSSIAPTKSNEFYSFLWSD